MLFAILLAVVCSCCICTCDAQGMTLTVSDNQPCDGDTVNFYAAVTPTLQSTSAYSNILILFQNFSTWTLQETYASTTTPNQRNTFTFAYTVNASAGAMQSFRASYNDFQNTQISNAIVVPVMTKSNCYLSNFTNYYGKNLTFMFGATTAYGNVSTTFFSNFWAYNVSGTSRTTANYSVYRNTGTLIATTASTTVSVLTSATTANANSTASTTTSAATTSVSTSTSTSTRLPTTTASSAKWTLVYSSMASTKSASNVYSGSITLNTVNGVLQQYVATVFFQGVLYTSDPVTITSYTSSASKHGAFGIQQVATALIVVLTLLVRGRNVN